MKVDTEKLITALEQTKHRLALYMAETDSASIEDYKLLEKVEDLLRTATTNQSTTTLTLYGHYEV